VFAQTRCVEPRAERGAATRAFTTAL
jgi:hypothetical protein